MTIDNLSVKAVVETTVTVTSSWTRVATASATVTNPIVLVKLATSGDAIDVALFQIENGAFITSPIPTVASQVTRAADNITILTSAFPYNESAGTIVAEGDWADKAQGMIAAIQEATSNEAHWLYARSVLYQGVKAGVPVVNIGGLSNNTSGKRAAAYTSGSYAFAADGTLVGTSSYVGVPTGATTLHVGRYTAANWAIGGHIKRLDYYAVRKSNAELVVLST